MSDYPGEIIKETIWSNIKGNELSDYPANVADKIVAALEAAGYVITRRVTDRISPSNYPD